jgi:hypothetical protein
MKMIIIGTLQHRQSDIEVDSRLEGLVRRVIDVKSLAYSSLMCVACFKDEEDLPVLFLKARDATSRTADGTSCEHTGLGNSAGISGKPFTYVIQHCCGRQ